MENKNSYFYAEYKSGYINIIEGITSEKAKWLFNMHNEDKSRYVKKLKGFGWNDTKDTITYQLLRKRLENNRKAI